MDKTKLTGQEPAFPIPNFEADEETLLLQGHPKFGMSKRFLVACQIAPTVIHAALTHKETATAVCELAREKKKTPACVVSEMVYKYADELIRQDNEFNNKNK